ncbi:MAG: hypothetical protein JOY51_07695, partial [Nevskia sp.]|nr:hypothetical protein [Nevskia sp.]
HDFQIHAGQLAEADESIAELGRFMREKTKAVVSDQSSVVGRKRPASSERLTTI